MLIHLRCFSEPSGKAREFANELPILSHRNQASSCASWFSLKASGLLITSLMYFYVDLSVDAIKSRNIQIIEIPCKETICGLIFILCLHLYKEKNVYGWIHVLTAIKKFSRINCQSPLRLKCWRKHICDRKMSS